jgi:hypothetical protein
VIDTIKLSYPVFPELVTLIEANRERLVKLSPSGEVVWEKSWVKDALPSHFEGLRMSLLDGKGLRNQGFTNARTLVQFEFSLQKWQSETGYNNKNTTIEQDLEAFDRWISLLSDCCGFQFEKELFELYRVDLSQNFILQGVSSVEEYLRALDVKFSRHPNGENVTKYKGCIFYGSSWISKKIYWKWLEFQEIERKKKKNYYIDRMIEGENTMGSVFYMHNGKKPLTSEEINGMLRMLRFELGYKRTYLDRTGIIRIPDIPKLLDKYEEERQRYMTVKKLGDGIRLSNAEYVIVDLCKRYGVNGAKAEYCKTHTERAWYKHKRNLVSKGVYIESILREDWLQEIQQTDNLCDFELRLAA